MRSHRKIGLGTLLAVIVASAVLAAPGGAGKPADGITCGPTSTTLTWRPGIDSYSFTISTSGAPIVYMSNPAVPIPNSPGSVSVTTPRDPSPTGERRADDDSVLDANSP